VRWSRKKTTNKSSTRVGGVARMTDGRMSVAARRLIDNFKHRCWQTQFPQYERLEIPPSRYGPLIHDQSQRNLVYRILHFTYIIQNGNFFPTLSLHAFEESTRSPVCVVQQFAEQCLIRRLCSSTGCAVPSRGSEIVFSGDNVGIPGPSFYNFLSLFKKTRDGRTVVNRIRLFELLSVYGENVHAIWAQGDFLKILYIESPDMRPEFLIPHSKCFSNFLILLQISFWILNPHLSVGIFGTIPRLINLWDKRAVESYIHAKLRLDRECV
jgi:hypothetical protein